MGDVREKLGDVMVKWGDVRVKSGGVQGEIGRFQVSQRTDPVIRGFQGISGNFKGFLEELRPKSSDFRCLPTWLNT